MDIKKVLKDKHEQFINSLFHQESKDIIRNNTYFAGGCIRDLNNGRIPKDYDLFFYDEASMQEFLKLAEMNFTLKKSRAGNYDCKVTKVQVITISLGNPEELIKTFDFTINNGFYDIKKDVLALPAEKTNLILNSKVSHPFNALLRISKFVSMGYKVQEKVLFQLGILMVKFDSEKEAIDSLSGVSTSFLKAKEITRTTFHSDDFDDTPMFTSSDDIPF